ncbi:MAG TPA: hypothetical protein VK932_10135 [Kofleriaceae bacterium]|nr:hypothetical protein [Kofleriaceae bacterium]
MLVAHPEHEKYALRAIGSPAGVSATAVAAAIGAWQLGILGSFLLGLVAVAVALGAATRPSVRRRLDRTAARRARDRREAARLAVLGASSCWMHRDRYITLREEIEECERRDPAAARRRELEPLLDHFVRSAVRHQRCVDALPAPFGLLTSSTAPLSGRRRELAARRRRCQQDCERHAERLSEEIDAIEELVRLIEQQLAASELQLVGDPAQDDDDELGRRLAKLDELDELDTAMRQVSS